MTILKSIQYACFPLLLALSSTAQAEPLKVGQSIPDCSLKTESGEVVRLQEMVQAKPSLIIFYRGGWCPYCVLHLSALASIEQKVLAAGYQILAISTDQPSKLREMQDGDKIGYTLLSDSSMEAAKSFGIAFRVPDGLVEKYIKEYKIDLEAASGETHHLLPHPSVFTVGTDGVIQFAHVNENYKERLSPDEILAAIHANP